MAATSDEAGNGPAPAVFGQVLKRLRAAADLTQEELAERAGVSARLVSDLERGAIVRPRRDTVRMLADGLNLTEADRVVFAEQARGRSARGGRAAGAAVMRHSTLPLPPTAIVGRDREVAATTSLLMQPEVRLLTLVGPGGVGKTRLALDVAFRVVDAFTDGVWFIDLAPVADPALVLPSIAGAIGVRESGERPLRDSLVGSLQGQQVLLVLDNLEHLTAAAFALGELLGECEGLTILATSRQPLRLRAEHEYAVGPLALPDLGRLPSTDDLSRVPAVDLFVRRAEVARRTFALTAENAREVAEIAVRLDGLPLAIELAAAWIKVLSPSALRARLEHRLPLLTGGAQDLPARQQTMRATLDWSHDLLAPDEQTLFRRLAVFAGGCTLEAAEAVCGPERADGSEQTAERRVPISSADSVLDGIASLVDKSLLRVLDQDEDARFGMLETMREYGLACLTAAGEEAAVRDHHARWCLELSERAEPALMGPEQEQWYSRIEVEHDNLRAAHAWAIERRDAATALRLPSAIQRFWTTRGQLGEGRRWLEQALSLDVDVPSAVRAKALGVAAHISYYQGDYQRAEMLGEEALTRYRALDDQNGIAVALASIAGVTEAKGDNRQAVALFEEALRLFRLTGNEGRACGVINNLGLLAWRQGDLARAAMLHEEALTLRRKVGDRVGLAGSLSNLGLVAADQGDFERASALERESLSLEVALGNRRGLADSFENLARIAEAIREDERAARLFGAAEVLRERLGFPPVPFDHDTNQRRIAHLAGRLGDAVFAMAWNVGRAMTLDDAIAFALDPVQQMPAGDPRSARRDD